MRSLRRPGVATTTSAPRRSAPDCRLIDMPPTTVATRRFTAVAYGVEGVGDLLGELTGGNEDQRERGVRLGAAAGGAGEQRQAEGERLAGAGAAAAEDVTAGERVRQRGGLDRERLGHALGRRASSAAPAGMSSSSKVVDRREAPG